METVGDWLAPRGASWGGKRFDGKDLITVGGLSGLSALFFHYAPQYASMTSLGLAALSLGLCGPILLNEEDKERPKSIRAAYLGLKVAASLTLGGAAYWMATSALAFTNAIRSLQPLSFTLSSASQLLPCLAPLLVCLRSCNMLVYAYPHYLLSLASILEGNQKSICDHLQKHPFTSVLEPLLEIQGGVQTIVPALLVGNFSIFDEAKKAGYEFIATLKAGHLLLGNPQVAEKLLTSEEKKIFQKEKTPQVELVSDAAAPSTTSDHLVQRATLLTTDSYCLKELEQLKANPKTQGSVFSYGMWALSAPRPTSAPNSLAMTWLYATYFGLELLNALHKPIPFSAGIVARLAINYLPLGSLLTLADWLFVYTPDKAATFAYGSLLQRIFMLAWVPTRIWIIDHSKANGFFGGFFATEAAQQLCFKAFGKT